MPMFFLFQLALAPWLLLLALAMLPALNVSFSILYFEMPAFPCFLMTLANMDHVKLTELI